MLVLATGCGSEPATPPVPSAQEVQVARVIDGDTFATTDGRVVHVAGIESCDLRTPGGSAAVAAATGLLGGAPGGTVLLGPSSGPDALPTGELLRSVLVGAVDYAEQMLPAEHTGVGTGDVAAAVPIAYLSTLQSLDTRGSDRSPPVARSCEAPPAPPTTTTTTTRTTTPARGDGDEDRNRTYLPDPPRRTQDDDSSSGGSSRGGSSGGDGHPCLPGERDGDKDGLCGES